MKTTTFTKVTLALTFFSAFLTSQNIWGQTPYIKTTSAIGQYGYLEKDANTIMLLNSNTYGNIYQLFGRTWLNGTNILTYGTAVNSCGGSNIDQATNNYNFGANAIAGQIAYTSVHTDYCGGGNSYGGNPNQAGFNERQHYIFDIDSRNTDNAASIVPGANNVVASLSITFGAVSSRFLNRLWIQNTGTMAEATDIANDGFKLYYEPITGSEVFDGTESSATLYGDYAGNATNNNVYGHDALGIAIPSGGLRVYVVLNKFAGCPTAGKTVIASTINDGLSFTPNMDASYSLARVGQTPLSPNTITLAAGYPIGAALSGTYYIPSPCLPTIASAATALNTYGVSGAVTFNVAAGYTEPATVGGIVFGGATGISGTSATNTITFQKFGSGSNPLVTAFSPQVAAGVMDAVIKLVGADYMTFDAINVRENPSNTTTTTASNNMTEFGYGIFYGSATNGSQNNTIKNCAITLNTGATTYSSTFGIFATTMTTSTSNTSANITNASGANNNNKLYGNVISGCNIGISVVGSSTANRQDTGWDIGGTSLAQGNTINSFGMGLGSPATSYTNVSGTVNGIVVNQITGYNISYNTMTSTAATVTASALTGIFMNNGTQPTGTITQTCNYNVITVNSGSLSSNCIGIQSTMGNSTTTLSISNNKVTAKYTVGSSTSGSLRGILNSVAVAGLNISTDTIYLSHEGASATNASPTAYILSDVGVGSGGLTISNNLLNNPTLQAVKTTSAFYGISHSATMTGTVNINSNTINVSRGSVGGTAATFGVFSFGSTALTGLAYQINSNNITISNMSGAGGTGTSSCAGIFNGDGSAAANAPAKTINGNTISISGTNTGLTRGIAFDYGSITSNTNSITLSTASVTLDGIGTYINSAGATTGSFSSNTISLTTTSASAATLVGVNMPSSSFATSTAISGGSVSLTANSSISPTLIGALHGAAVPCTISGGTYGPFSATAVSTSAPTMAGVRLNSGTNNSISGVTVNSFTTGASSGTAIISGIYIAGGTTPAISKNNIYNLSSSSTGTSSVVSGINFQAGTTTFDINNNLVSNLTNAASNALGILGINCAATSCTYRIYNNTIVLGTSVTPVTNAATNFGGCAVGFLGTANTTLADLRNNILWINGTARGTGGLACVMSTGSPTANTPSASFATTSNNNIYNINSGSQNYLFVQGSSTANFANGYALSGLTASVPQNINNDPLFNTSCSKYKTFIATGAAGRENATFSENNLGAVTPPTSGGFAPSSNSFAENGAQTISTPSITTDFNGSARTAGSNNDIGAIQFNGTATDAVAPTITYTPATVFPNTTSTCNLTVSIPVTDANAGVNTTAGTRPRLWFKKSGEADALPATNTSANSGWKWVEATNTTSPFSFTIDYSLLTSAVVAADVIQYFVVAQDNAGTANVATSSVTYASGYCPSSVALAAGAFPTVATPNSYTISASAASGTATSSVSSICVSGTTNLNITPTGGVLTGLTYQWQSSPAGAGTFTDISGATTLPYTTSSVTASTDYQCVVKNCASATVFTSSIVSVSVSSPTVASTTPGNRCGTGTVTLGATASGGGTLKWYAASTGGAVLGTGTSFTTPSISTTTNYFVASESNGGSTLTATLGAGATTSTGYESPFYHFYGGVKEQHLITAAELTTLGFTAGVSISSIAYNFVTAGTTFNGFTMHMKLTSTSALSTTFESTGLTQVVTSTNLTPTTGFYSIPLNTSFVWDGTSNLLIQTSWSNNNGGGTSATVKYDNTSFVSLSQYAVDSQTPATVLAATTASTTLSRRPQMRFNYTPVCSSARTSVAANINNPPSITITPASASICAGQSQGITVTSSNDPNYTYTWSNSLPSGASQTVSPSSTTTYTVTATDASVTGTYNGCVTTGSVPVTVNAVPTGVTATASSTNICSGNTINLTGAVTPSSVSLINEGFESGATPSGWLFLNAGTGNNWAVPSTLQGSARTGTKAMECLYHSSNAANAWAFTNGLSLTAGTTYTISYWYRTNSLAEKFKLTVGNAQTTASQTTVLQDNPSVQTTTYTQQTVTYTPSSTGTYYFAWNCYSIANQWYVEIDDISITYTPTYTYSWTSSPAGFTSSSQNPTGATPTNGIIYSLAATNAAGCSATASTSAITVRPLPSAPATTNSSQCGTGAPTASVASTAGVDGSGTYKWYNASTGGTLLQTSTSTTYTSSIATTTVFYVSEMGVNGCESARSSVTVTVVSPPSITVAASPTTICAGITTSLSVSSSNDPNYTYAWSNGLGSGASVSASPTTTTTYTVTATDASVTGTYNSCVTTGTVMVTVNPLPTITSATATPSTVCSGDAVALSGKSISASSSNIAVGTSSGNTVAAQSPYRSGVATEARMQYLFTAAELSAAGLTAGNINSISFNVTSLGATSIPTYSIGMALVSSSTTALTTTFVTGITNVYGPVTQTVASGAIVHTLSSPFYWDGTSSLVINICHGGPNGTNSQVASDAQTNKTLTNSGASSCSGTTGTLQARRPIVTFNTSPNQAASYTWTWNPGAISGATTTINPTNATSSPVTTTYTVSALDVGSGCSATASVGVTVNPVAPAVTAANSAQCGAGVPTCSVTSNSGAGSPTFRWYTVSTGGTAIVGETGASLASYIVSAVGTTSFFVSEWNGLCESPRTQVDVVLTAAPVLTASASPLAVCLGASTSLSASGTGYTSFTWSGAALASSSGSPVSASPTTAGSYNVTATGGGCTNTATVAITVIPSPTTPVLSPTSVNICGGVSQTLTVTPPSSTSIFGTGTSALGTTSYPNPFSAYYGGVKHQILFTKTEILAQGGITGATINALTFDFNAFVGNACTDFTIRMGHTTLSALTGFVTGTTTVYNSLTYTPSQTGLVTFALNTPFVWNGNDNIVLETVHNAGNGGNGSGTLSNYTTTGFNSVYYGAKDNVAGGISGFDALSTWTSNGASANRPNVRFTYAAPAYTWSPSSTLSASTGASVTATPTATTTYTVSATAANGCISTASAVVTINSGADLVTLAPSTTTACVPQCTENGWTYYANTATPTEWVFAIKWAPDGTLSTANSTAKNAATVDLNINAGGWSQTGDVTTGGVTYNNCGSWLMNRYWNVNNAGTFDEPVDIRFYYDPAAATAAETAAQAYQSANPATGVSYEGSTWFKTVGMQYNNSLINANGLYGDSYSSGIAMTPSTTSTEHGVNYVEFASVSSFSGGGFGAGVGPTGSTPLPVELLYFTGEKIQEEASSLRWATATEHNNHYFGIMRSRDGINFEEIGRVMGAGTSTSEHHYSFIDHSPSAGVNYYYLRQTDTDGSTTPSNMISLTFGKKFDVKAYPNPFQSAFFVDVYTETSGDAIVEVFDMTGRSLYSSPAVVARGLNKLSIPTESWTLGNYVLKVTNGNETSTVKIVKSE